MIRSIWMRGGGSPVASGVDGTRVSESAMPGQFPRVPHPLTPMLSASRSSGVILPPTSLPRGRLGPEAHAFVDWLSEAGQTWWQMLPLGPPDEHGSPYKAASAFAAWRGLLADPDAPVSAVEAEDFRRRHPAWIGDWEAFAGQGAVADQVRFEREWAALRSHAAARGVRLLGDVPIYIAPGSADHFRGFVSAWAIPEEAPTAAHGHWRRGPGRAVFGAIRRELGTLPLVAENLGVITPAVEYLRRELGLPGMVVLEFGFDPDDPRGPHRMENHEADSVVCTGTHDHDPVAGWYATLDADAR